MLLSCLTTTIRLRQMLLTNPNFQHRSLARSATQLHHKESLYPTYRCLTSRLKTPCSCLKVRVALVIAERFSSEKGFLLILPCFSYALTCRSMALSQLLSGEDFSEPQEGSTSDAIWLLCLRPPEDDSINHAALVRISAHLGRYATSNHVGYAISTLVRTWVRGDLSETIP